MSGSSILGSLLFGRWCTNAPAPLVLSKAKLQPKNHQSRWPRWSLLLQFDLETAAFTRVKATVTTEPGGRVWRGGESSRKLVGGLTRAVLRVGGGSSKQPLKTTQRQRVEERPSRETDGETGRSSARENHESTSVSATGGSAAGFK